MRISVILAALLLSACATHSRPDIDQIGKDIGPYIQPSFTEVTAENDQDLTKQLLTIAYTSELKFCSLRVYFGSSESCSGEVRKEPDYP